MFFLKQLKGEFSEKYEDNDITVHMWAASFNYTGQHETKTVQDSSFNL